MKRLVSKFALTSLFIGLGATAEPVLHVDIPSPLLAGGDNTVVGPKPGANQNPDAIRTDGKYLPRPDVMAPKGNQNSVGPQNAAQIRPDRLTPDTNTGADGTLHYEAVFDPSIAPFKRNNAVSTVDSSYAMKVPTARRTDVTVGGKTQADRDLFWGSIVVEFSGRTPIPLPSVAPDMRILSYETKRNVTLRFSKDGADNFFVTPKSASTSGQHRVVFLVDAPARYFAPSMPFGYKLADITRAAPAQYLHSLPADVQKQAKRAIKQLKLTPQTDLRDGINTLVAYFRSFQAKPLSSSGDVFWDLFSQQAGVCRHRSFAFLVVATELGIPTRYVHNEAHAFVEIWLPGNEWARLDLGGAATNLDISNAQQKTMYRPRSQDPFAKPKAYSQNYTNLQGNNVTGLSDDQKAEIGQSRQDDQRNSNKDENDKDLGLPQIKPKDVRNKTKTVTTVDYVDQEGFRGEDVRVRGTLKTTDGKPVGDQRIDIYLAKRGNPKSARKIGHGKSNADGTFSLIVDLPKSLDARTYEVFAGTPGDSRVAPSLSK